MSTSARIYSGPRATSVALVIVAVFVVSFSIPFLLTVKYGSLLVPGAGDSPLDLEHEEVFPTSFRVARPGDTFRVEHGEGMAPISGKDFLLSVWFKLSKPLEIGQRAVIFGKYDPKSKTRPGYSLMLQRDADGTRPVLYWGGEAAPGRWYSFSPLENSGRAWTMLAISFRQGKLLGMHVGSIDRGVPVELLGGYEVDAGIDAKSDAALVVGAFGDSDFRGRIGPLSIVSASNLSDSLVETISAVRNAREVPAEDSIEADIHLWVSGKKDVSARNNRVSANSSVPVHSGGAGEGAHKRRLS